MNRPIIRSIEVWANVECGYRLNFDNIDPLNRILYYYYLNNSMTTGIKLNSIFKTISYNTIYNHTYIYWWFVGPHISQIDCLNCYLTIWRMATYIHVKWVRNPIDLDRCQMSIYEAYMRWGLCWKDNWNHWHITMNVINVLNESQHERCTLNDHSKCMIAVLSMTIKVTGQVYGQFNLHVYTIYTAHLNISIIIGT